MYSTYGPSEKATVDPSSVCEPTGVDGSKALHQQAEELGVPCLDGGALMFPALGTPNSQSRPMGSE